MSEVEQERLKAALFEALALSGAERAQYLASLEGKSRDLAREVRALLEEQTHPGMKGRAVAGAAVRALGDRVALPEAGREVGPYRLVELIGTGGMGAVYRAEQLEPIRREVALKLLVGGGTLGRVADRFAAERRALSLLEHPGIARILDAGADATGTSYIAMELVHGSPITRYVREKGLREEAILELFVSICRAVQSAHQKGVVHRDLKPSNILVADVDGRPTAKIIDFGIARIVEGEEAGVSRSLLTAEGQVIGTLEYMSPEQAEGRSREVDTRADVYSLGVLLYELLTDGLPYELGGRSLTQAIEIIRREPPRPFAATRGDGKPIASDLETITRKALEKDPARRYEGAGALADDVERYRRAEPIVARPPSTAYQMRMLVRRHRGVVTFVGAAFTVVAIFGVTMAVLYAGQRRERERAEAEARKAEAVNEFLQQMLGSADPEEMGRNVTVREVMDQALRTMGASMVGYPDVRATVEATLGKTYFSLGEWGLADSLTRVAYERMHSAKGERSPETIALLRARAYVASHRKQMAEADSLGRRALRLSEEVLGPRSLETARCLSTLGELWYEVAPARSESLLTRSITIADLIGEAGLRVRQDAMLFLAESYLRLSRYTEAESTYVRVIRSLEHSAGDHAPRTLEARRDLASLYSNTGRYRLARDILVTALDFASSNFGAEHPMTAAFMNDLAVAEIYLTSYARAESLQVATVRIWARTLGEGHPYLSVGYQNLGYIAHCRTHYREAVDWYRKAIAMQHSDDARDVMHMTPYANLVHALCDLGRSREAIPIAEQLERAMAFRERSGRSTLGVAEAHDACGWAFYDAGEYQRSARHLQWSYDDGKSGVRGPDRLYKVRANLALARYRAGDRDSARLWLDEAAPHVIRSTVTVPPHKRTTLHRLAAHFRETGQDSLARACQIALEAIPR